MRRILKAHEVVLTTTKYFGAYLKELKLIH